MSLQSFEERLQELGPDPSRESLIQAMREAVMAEVEQKVQDKVEELWTKGKQAFSQAQARQREQMQKVLDEVSQCQARQVALATENERLREALRDLSSKCSALPGVLGPDTMISPGSTLAGTPPLQLEEAGAGYPQPFSPLPFAPADFQNYAGEAVLPEVPAMPIPSPATGAPGAPAPLSLAEALGPRAAQRTPLSLAESLCAESDASPTQSLTFSVAITKASGAELGLDVSHETGGKVLRVDGIRQNGAVQAWNKTCAAMAQSEQAICVGDKITRVNSVGEDPVKMLEECVAQQTLSLELMREPPGKVPGASPIRSGVLRADASEFVPRSGLEVSAVEEA